MHYFCTVPNLICDFFIILQKKYKKTEVVDYKDIKEMKGEWKCYRSLRHKKSKKGYDQWDYFYVAPKGSKYINKWKKKPAKKHLFELVSSTMFL